MLTIIFVYLPTVCMSFVLLRRHCERVFAIHVFSAVYCRLTFFFLSNRPWTQLCQSTWPKSQIKPQTFYNKGRVITSADHAVGLIGH